MNTHRRTITITNLRGNDSPDIHSIEIMPCVDVQRVVSDAIDAKVYKSQISYLESNGNILLNNWVVSIYDGPTMGSIREANRAFTMALAIHRINLRNRRLNLSLLDKPNLLTRIIERIRA